MDLTEHRRKAKVTNFAMPYGRFDDHTIAMLLIEVVLWHLHLKPPAPRPGWENESRFLVRAYSSS